jgi:signal transduction histidine kinase
VPEHREITVTTDTVDDHARLIVDNTGPPVPPYDISSLFEPFRRLPTAERLADSNSASTGRGAEPLGR